jgi:lipopolysaccharide/colanic/teichoic acid biosynthesis glycosyltransferase
MESRGGMFFSQKRVGKNEQPFQILKFRTMFVDSEKKSQITVGDRDPRITRVGFFLRNYKLDELPQFWNVLIGEMSIVGPRPEVPY